MLEKVPSALRTIANPIRFNIVKILRCKEHAQYSELMKRCGLDPLTQTGVFNYHIGHMLRIGVINKERDGTYVLTELGRKISDLLLAIENAYPIAFRHKLEEGEKMEKVKNHTPKKKREVSEKGLVYITMHRSGLYYIQSDIDPDFVKSIVFLAYRDGRVVDIVPIFKTRISPDACTSLEDVKKLKEEKYADAFVSVLIEIV